MTKQKICTLIIGFKSTSADKINMYCGDPNTDHSKTRLLDSIFSNNPVFKWSVYSPKAFKNQTKTSSFLNGKFKIASKKSLSFENRTKMSDFQI